MVFWDAINEWVGLIQSVEGLNRTKGWLSPNYEGILLLNCLETRTSALLGCTTDCQTSCSNWLLALQICPWHGLASLCKHVSLFLIIDLCSFARLLLACFWGESWLIQKPSLLRYRKVMNCFNACHQKSSQPQSMNCSIQVCKWKLEFVHPWFTKAEIQELYIKCSSWHQSKNGTLPLCDHKGRTWEHRKKTLCHSVHIKDCKCAYCRVLLINTLQIS